MPSDNALLPPIIHLGYLTENDVIEQIQQARESIRFVGPAPSKGSGHRACKSMDTARP